MNTTFATQSDLSVRLPASRSARRWGRSAGAVLAGAIAIGIASHGADAALRALGVYPAWGTVMSNGAFAMAATYRLVFGAMGAWLAARLAPSRPMKHAVLLGVIGTVLSVLAAVATWNGGPEVGPHWYPLVLIALTLPSAVAGAQWHRARAVVS